MNFLRKGGEVYKVEEGYRPLFLWVLLLQGAVASY